MNLSNLPKDEQEQEESGDEDENSLLQCDNSDTVFPKSYRYYKVGMYHFVFNIYKYMLNFIIYN